MFIGNSSRAEKIEIPTIYETYKLEKRVSVYSKFSLGTGLHKLTTVPNDQISVAVFQGVSIITSGLVHMGAPTGVPPLAYSESEGYDPPRSPS